jgi:hypothetical protein
MGKTTEVAADRAYDQTKTVLPTEVAQGVYMQNAPSLRALKMFHLMIATAGGRAHSDTSDQVFRRHMISHSGVSDHPEMTPSGAVW